MLNVKKFNANEKKSQRIQVLMAERIAILNLEVKALLVQVVDPITAKQTHLAVVTVGRIANRMVCKYCI